MQLFLEQKVNTGDTPMFFKSLKVSLEKLLEDVTQSHQRAFLWCVFWLKEIFLLDKCVILVKYTLFI